ncbi:DMT family transporter [Plantibacter sp. PA-3-X8]|uniref:EamA family transporter n=1 Tax=Plantibacter sp. PA-3-X8 TaxID=2480625 RepID=UPI001F15683A|nr:EamA family transporter [Plantibacter sp. PA-3-X8]
MIRRPRPSQAATGALLVLAGLVCQELGASIAVTLFPQVGPIGMVTLRLVFAALILLAVARPALGGHPRSAWGSAVGFGLVLAAMNVCFYLALDRIPLGPAVTLEILGPLALSVIAGRRWTSALWAGVALVGVLLLGGGLLHSGPTAALDPLGVILALAAGALWIGYILLSARTGTEFPGLNGLAIAAAIGALVTIPLAATTAGTALFDPVILLLGLGVAALSSAVPYALEFVALRRLSAATFSILLASAPAIAAIAGLLVLGQELTTPQWLGIACVVGAGIGAVLSARRGRAPEVQPSIAPS